MKLSQTGSHIFNNLPFFLSPSQEGCEEHRTPHKSEQIHRREIEGMTIMNRIRKLEHTNGFIDPVFQSAKGNGELDAVPIFLFEGAFSVCLGMTL